MSPSRSVFGFGCLGRPSENKQRSRGLRSRVMPEAPSGGPWRIGRRLVAVLRRRGLASGRGERPGQALERLAQAGDAGAHVADGGSLAGVGQEGRLDQIGEGAEALVFVEGEDAGG